MPCETRFHPNSSVRRRYETPKVSISSAPEVKESESERAETVEAADWSDWSVKELKQYCSELEMKSYSRLKRPELEALLNEAGASPR